MLRITAASLCAVSTLGQDLFLKSLSDNGTCSLYGCSGCGACFNAGGRPGKLCRGQQTGYYCTSDNPQEGSDMAFACMDWTFGSSAMRSAEKAFAARAGEDVFFGVGTFGTQDDVQRGLGSCFRIKAEGVAKELLVQSINTGSDVSGNQFDLQVGDGGAGAYNTCAGGTRPGVDTMYPGPYDADTWGKQYGGVDNRTQCSGLPSYPSESTAMKAAGDDLVELCKYGFDQGVRKELGHNPSILSIGRVQCPEELVAFTRLQRTDDPSGYSCGDACAQAEKECTVDSLPWQGAAWCLTRMMDCRKPSGAFKDNVKGEVMVEGRKVVQTCASDGYTRFDVQCGCPGCYC